jgi:N-hydroxyarylamine O-acetyltransferase
MDPERYLARIGVADGPSASGRADGAEGLAPTLETVAALQAAHVTTVPFETLSITGDPSREHFGEGVSLALPELYSKIVGRGRGGFCYELNGLFVWLLEELGFAVDRLAAQVLDDDGDPRPPANHHTVRVTLDRPYLVDVGLGLPKMREPLPVDGRVGPDAAGVEWRTVESDRPDADHVVQDRGPGDDEWADRYIFTETPRDLSYFEATCEHLATAPESHFTGDPYVNLGTTHGHRSLSPDTLIRVDGGEEREDPVAPGDYLDVLAREFGIRPERD